MGHADRPRLHNAFSVDTQSRGVRLSIAERRHSYSDAHIDSNTYRDAESYSHSNGNGNGNRNTDAQTYPDSKTCSFSAAASYAAATAITRG